MRKFLALLCLTAFLASAAVADPSVLKLRAGPELYHSSLMSSAGTFGVRPRLSVDYALLHDLVFLGEYAHSRIAFGPGRLIMNTIGIGLGYRLLEDRLLLGALVSSTSYQFTSYQSNSAKGFGLRATYEIPLGEGSKFSLVPMLGLNFHQRVTLQRDTGVARSNSAFANALCALFTLGLADGCGNITEYLSVPPSREVLAGAQLQYQF